TTSISSRSQDQTGYAVYTGIRYDLPTKTKIGFEYNYGSKSWITSSPVAKAGNRGNVYEPFIIQEINFKPVTSFFQKTFLRAGYQYFEYDSTFSNNWMGVPITMSAINSGMLQPATHSYSVYGAFEVHF
ncbi:MAG: DUF3373 family protein, partial [Deltaproteobacteria bacterium]|nr:DUF3373 family protein [Deltaproteobacteria bacterium]